MKSRITFLGHPVHQMLIVFPMGLLGMAVIFDVIYFVTNNPSFADAAFYMIGAGVLSGIIASPFGTIDWLAIPRGTRAKSVGAVHGAGNLLVLIFFALSWFLRSDAPYDPGAGAYLLSFLGLSVTLITGWLGGELVNRLGVGVSDRPHVNAPSSLKKDDDKLPPGVGRGVAA